MSGPRSRPNAERNRRPPAPAGWTIAALCCALLAGCADQVKVNYGERDNSVNGTAVFAKMFAESGRRVTSRSALTPATEKAATIVWFADTPDAPSQPVIDWFENWLLQAGKRTLIYVRRDYNAAPDYWRQAAALAPPEAREEFQFREKAARLLWQFEQSRAKLPLECDWFRVEKAEPREAGPLAGPLAAGMTQHPLRDPEAIKLNSQMIADGRFEPLLESKDDEIVCRRFAADSQIVIVANGSFLLNLPLVNYEHRRLAGRLIDESRPGGSVAFLETDGDPEILDREPQPDFPRTLAILGVWPLNVVLLHFAVIGILFCFARWPIFGRPQEPAPLEIGDFSLHAEALGKLLQRAADSRYAQQRVDDYRGAK